jgi:hypothetical protein
MDVATVNRQEREGNEVQVEVASRRRTPETIKAAFPGAVVLDVTSRAAAVGTA